MARSWSHFFLLRFKLKPEDGVRGVAWKAEFVQLMYDHVFLVEAFLMFNFATVPTEMCIVS